MALGHQAVVVGAGPAGLAVSRELTAANVGHVVLERDRIGESWRRRWRSFCLVTPNWTVQLPGHPYDGSDPDGFMPRDSVVAYLERYAGTIGAPVREGVAVRAVSRSEDGFAVDTSTGPLTTRNLVIASGTYQLQHRPRGADSLPGNHLQIDVGDYQAPDALPPGGVLVVGSGQSGCQIAEELCESGRRVVLACGRAPWAPRRLDDHDIAWWAAQSGFLDAPVSSLPNSAARLGANMLATGRNGGHDLNLRTLRAIGVTLVGRFLGAEGSRALFAPDLADSVAWGDARYQQLMSLMPAVATRHGMRPPAIVPPEPFDGDAPTAVDLSSFGTVIFAGGFRPDFRSWLPWPAAFDDLGFPIQQNGTSVVVSGLHFVGVHFQRKRKSATLLGMGEDARIVADTVASDASGKAS